METKQAQRWQLTVWYIFFGAVFVSEYFSFRVPSGGSWFIQVLCKVLQKSGEEMELIRLLTRVNHKVAHKYEANAKEKAFCHKKQVPSIVSRLTKEVYFRPKH